MKFPRTKGHIVRCRRCIPCRSNHQYRLKTRILLESYCHPESSFITLTYSDENCPPYLRKKDAQEFMKRLRINIQRAGLPKIRYFMIGEYGSKTMRPHYHAIVFGLPLCARGKKIGFRSNWSCTCTTCELVKMSWKVGMVHVGSVTPQSAAYVTGYCTKKGTTKHEDKIKALAQGDEEKYKEIKEFKVASIGLGKGIIDILDGYIKSDTHKREIAVRGDVVTHLKIMGENCNFDKYIKIKIRERNFNRDKHRIRRRLYARFSRDMQNLGREK